MKTPIMMNAKIYLGALVLFLSSCSNFLEESSQNEVRPSTVNDLIEIAAYEAYCTNTFLEGCIQYMTDDMESAGLQGNTTAAVSTTMNKYASPFMWSENMYEDLFNAMSSNSKFINHWENLYSLIKGCNVVLDYAYNVSGEEEKRENMRGQMLVLRGFYYFWLVNLYGYPYNYGNPADHPGVPLKINMDLNDELPTRNSVAEVYEQILKDIKEGERLLEKYPRPDLTLYRLTHVAAKALLARVYLYMEDYENSLAYVEKVLNHQKTLLNFTKSDASGIYTLSSGANVFNISNSPELIWAYSNGENYMVYYSRPSSTNANTYPWRISQELRDLYQDAHCLPYNYPVQGEYMGDLRFRRYFSIVGTGTRRSIPGSNGVVAYYYDYYCFVHGAKNLREAKHGLRVAEIYLIRAEINAIQFKETGADACRVQALADLNYLRENRFDTRNRAYVNVNITDADELIQFVRDERRRELCFEDGHRWFDLRRYGMPRLVHMFGPETPDTEYVLEEESPHYVLPIPQVVLERNPKLMQNVY